MRGNQDHKKYCKYAQHLRDAQTTNFGLVDNISLHELHTRYLAWRRFHQLNLTSACIHALALATDISRAKTHTLRIGIAPRTHLDHGGDTGKFFQIEFCQVYAMAEAKSLSIGWERIVEEVELHRATPRVRGSNIYVLVGIEVYPFPPYTSPFILNFKPKSLCTNWEWCLKELVQLGVKSRVLW